LYELVPGGTDIEVTSRNAEEYCDFVVAAFLEHGVRAQIDAFIQGFDAVFDSSKLNCIYEVCHGQGAVRIIYILLL